MILSDCVVCGKKKQLSFKNQELSNDQFKMNKIINIFLLTGDKFMPELHLKQPGFTYSACGTFTKYCERVQKFRETGNLKHLYRNELEKACFAHDAAYFDRAHEIARNCQYGGYQRALASMVYMVFDRKTDEQLELHKPVIKKFKRRKIYARFKDNIWAAELAEMESFSSKYENVKYLYVS